MNVNEPHGFPAEMQAEQHLAGSNSHGLTLLAAPGNAVNGSQAQQSSDININASIKAPTARKRGRPKKIPTTAVVDGPSIKPCRGRPPGTGHKQKARAMLGLPIKNATPGEKRGPGRPRKTVPPVTVELGHRAFVVPATQRLQSPSESTRREPEAVSFTLGLPPDRSIPPPPHQPPNGMHVEPATLGCHKIILDEDPQRPVESLSDEDDEDGATGDGLGEEDAEPNEGDEDDDELDGDGEQLESNGDGDPPCKRTSARLPMPGWLSEPFKAHVAECGPTFRDAKGRPPLYSIHHTFWFPQHSTFFFLDRDDPPPPQQLFNPRFFLWDPDALCTGIPCPNCRTSLQRHQPISRPRRCVDFNSTFWIIGYRYRCGRCLHPKSGKRTVTFRSWDPRILAVLSPTLAHEFPAQLSHRSGLSKTLFSWMRSCFNYGMGSKQFSDALRAEHILSHDLLELQYLESLAERSLKPWLQQEKWEAFPRYDDHGPLGPHLYTPCSTLCRDVYDGFMEDHRDEINQHTAMLTGEICAIDHSHKITKETVRVNGEQIFIGTLTVTNEKNQIRVCCFVATKSHSQYELALNRMRESLSLYGHSQPSLFYTDNMLDKKFLEDCFPSLRENVIPVEKYGHLEELKVPPEISIFIKNTRDTINDAMRTILDDVPQDDGVIVIGLGSEWNVKVNSQGKVLRKGRTAVVQIAYENRIYILQVADMLAEGSLPQQLKLLLSHPRILKAGRLVNTDLGYLQAACHSETPFVGGLDLAKSAKERRIISSTQCSLADLSAIILNKRLNKNVPERISPAWEDATLTQQQLDYASRDVYASLLIYRHLSTLDVPQRLGPSLTPSKGVPARESRTGARLVSPGFGREKKNWTPL